VWQAIVAVIGLVGSAAGAIWAAYVGTRRRVLAELEGRYDAALRDLRLGVYPQLWAALQPLAKYAREPPGPPVVKDIEALSTRLRRWYFEEGGIYLSAEAREAYFQLQDALTAVIASERSAPAKSTSVRLAPDTFRALQAIASWLRTTLTYDVGTRRRFSLAPAWADQDAEANRLAIVADTTAKEESKRIVLQLQIGDSSAGRISPD
jgi:hypothetical protein